MRIHKRAYVGSQLTVCGRVAKDLNVVGERNKLVANCRTCLMFDGKVPPANYADLMGYEDRNDREKRREEEFSTKNGEELDKFQKETSTPEHPYEYYLFKKSKVERRAINPNKVKKRSRINNDIVQFNFGQKKIIVPGNYGIQKKI